MENGLDVSRRYRLGARAHPGSGGFTLVELMVTVAVIAVLAALAYPAYQDQMRKGRRAAAQAFLVDAASRQQQHLLDARSYAVGEGAIAALNLTVPPEVSPFYSIAVEPGAPTTPPSYRLVATPLASGSQAADGALTLDHQGERTRAGSTGW